jgi:S-adenosylmethionine-diacylglycerol 3-amino-3-carboxypropyl transferase
MSRVIFVIGKPFGSKSKNLDGILVSFGGSALSPAYHDRFKMPRWLTNALNSAQDKAMFAMIGQSIMYNVSWEDPRLDCEMLDLGSRDTILMLTSGGCNVLDMMIEGPAKIVAADLNPRQNALLELKVVCIKHLKHDEFFQLFARSNEALFCELYRTTLRDKLSAPAREFWDANTSFFKNVHWSGMSGFAAKLILNIARLAGLGGLLDGE